MIFMKEQWSSKEKGEELNLSIIKMQRREKGDAT